jgi:glycine dehydrogenase subunit 1
MGKKGLQEVAVQNAQKAAYAAKAIAGIDGFSLVFSAPSFNEFVVRCPRSAEEILSNLRERDIIGGLALSKYYQGRDNDILVCVTETNTKAQIDSLAEGLAGI